MNKIGVWFMLALCYQFTQCLKLPEYIKPCHWKAPDVDDCILKAARNTIPSIANGDPKYKVPSLDPALIKELTIDEGSSGIGIKIAIRDASFRGIKDIDIRDAKLDYDKNTMSFDLYFPEIRMDSIYNISGKILQLPIEGYGNCTLLLHKINAHYVFDWEQRKNEDGKEYFKVTKSKFNVVPEKLHIKLENLFQGNKLLGDNMNIFLNENWKEIMKDLGPAIEEALAEFIRQVLNNIFDLVPAEHVFIYDHV